MRLIKVGAAVLNQTPMAWEHNRANVLRAVADAKSQGVSILCLPEMSLTGYGCEDEFHAPQLQQTALRMLHEVTAATEGIVVCVGLPVLYRNGLFNCAAFVANGRILGFVAKRHLAGDGIHYEPRWFKAWESGTRADLALDGVHYPFGDIYFDIGGVVVGAEICEDAWVATRPGGDLARRGVDIILNPSASHFAFGKIDTRLRFVAEGARAFSVSYVYANLLGNESGRAIYDGGAIIASRGEALAVGPRFSFSDFGLTTAVIDVDATRMNQARTASFRPDVRSGDERRIEAPFEYPQMLTEDPPPARAAWEASARRKEEEFARAVALGLFDYMRKSGSHGFVVSLSGGADSAAIALLVRLMVEFAVHELGQEGFIERLSHIERFRTARSVDDLVAALLVTIYQSTENSGAVTRAAAREVARAAGAMHLELDVDPLFKQCLGMVSGALGRPLTWERDDVAMQNVQARVRGPGAWLVANLRGALLLATSNRSEAAVGYATMDGDTCGGLSPLGGIDKAFLRRWLAWLETEGPAGHQRVPELACVTAQAPTAELRPPDRMQTDEADLMPYEVLDAIERAAIRDKQMPLEAFTLLKARFPQHGAAQLGVWVERFYRLWCRNQWKRERYAPSFHLDDESLDPRTWCRFPILSGGFEKELGELREHVASIVNAPPGGSGMHRRPGH